MPLESNLLADQEEQNNGDQNGDSGDDSYHNPSIVLKQFIWDFGKGLMRIAFQIHVHSSTGAGLGFVEDAGV